MIVDWICISTSLDPVAEGDIPQRQGEECDGDYDQYQVLHFNSWARLLPRSLFAPKPPDHTHGGGVLVLGENTLRTGEENRLVRPVAAILVLHVESVCQSEVIGGRHFLQGFSDLAKESAAVGEILCASTDVSPRCQLILGIRGAARRMRGRRRMIWRSVGPTVSRSHSRLPTGAEA